MCCRASSGYHSWVTVQTEIRPKTSQWGRLRQRERKNQWSLGFPLSVRSNKTLLLANHRRKATFAMQQHLPEMLVQIRKFGGATAAPRLPESLHYVHSFFTRARWRQELASGPESSDVGCA